MHEYHATGPANASQPIVVAVDRRIKLIVAPERYTYAEIESFQRRSGVLFKGLDVFPDIDAEAISGMTQQQNALLLPHLGRC
jgi:hypothetical protein